MLFTSLIPEYLPTVFTIGLVGLTFWRFSQFLKANGALIEPEERIHSH